jgi:hypothetical protein
VLSLLIGGRTDHLENQDADEQMRVLVLDEEVDLVATLTGRENKSGKGRSHR